MLSSDFHNVLSCLKSLSFQKSLEFEEQSEVLGRGRSLANNRSLVFRKNKTPESSARNIMYRLFPYNEKPTRTLNTTSLKCCLPSTDAIDRREKFMHAYEGLR